MFVTEEVHDFFFFFSSRRRHTRCYRDWSSDVCSSDLDTLPEGYRIETGGAIEESSKANGALIAVFPVMAIVMLGLLMVQLQSFPHLALVCLTAPLGLIGATGALPASNRPFGFVALL